MKVIVYRSDDEHCPERVRYLARIFTEGYVSPAPGKPKTMPDIHPIVFPGPTEAVREQAQRWWDEMIERERAKKKRGRKPKALEGPIGSSPAEIGEIL